TPLPWDANANGGFTSGEPWLPLGLDHEWVNVESEARDPKSMLSLYRALLALRRAEEALVTGVFEPVAASEQVLAYRRRGGSRALLVVLNMTPEASRMPVDRRATVLLSTHLDRAGLERSADVLLVRPNEGLIVEVL